MQQEEQVASYLELQHQLAAAKAAMRAVVNQPHHVLPFLQPGRLVNIAARASGTPGHPDQQQKSAYSVLGIGGSLSLSGLASQCMQCL